MKRYGTLAALAVCLMGMASVNYTARPAHASLTFHMHGGPPCSSTVCNYWCGGLGPHLACNTGHMPDGSQINNCTHESE